MDSPPPGAPAISPSPGTPALILRHGQRRGRHCSNESDTSLVDGGCSHNELRLLTQRSRAGRIWAGQPVVAVQGADITISIQDQEFCLKILMQSRRNTRNSTLEFTMVRSREILAKCQGPKMEPNCQIWLPRRQHHPTLLFRCESPPHPSESFQTDVNLFIVGEQENEEHENSKWQE